MSALRVLTLVSKFQEYSRLMTHGHDQICLCDQCCLQLVICADYSGKVVAYDYTVMDWNNLDEGINELEEQLEVLRW